MKTDYKSHAFMSHCDQAMNETIADYATNNSNLSERDLSMIALGYGKGARNALRILKLHTGLELSYD